MLTTVVLDVGETLLDETPHWAAWAQWLGVPPFTLYGVLGGLVARGDDHREVVALLRPGSDFATERAAKDAAGPPPPLVLYPDAQPCLEALRADGWRVVVGGNQPASLLAGLDLRVDAVTSSGALGVEKPAAGFYRGAAATVGAEPEECVHVGDRVDNDVVGALAAGMAAVHLRRGPWGVLREPDLPPGVPRIEHLSALPPLLRALRAR